MHKCRYRCTCRCGHMHIVLKLYLHVLPCGTSLNSSHSWALPTHARLFPQAEWIDWSLRYWWVKEWQNYHRWWVRNLATFKFLLDYFVFLFIRIVYVFNYVPRVQSCVNFVNTGAHAYVNETEPALKLFTWLSAVWNLIDSTRNSQGNAECIENLSAWQFPNWGAQKVYLSN